VTAPSSSCGGSGVSPPASSGATGQSPTARARNRRFGRLSALRADAKVPCKNELVKETLRLL
jgi:hypothetical protein